MQARDREAQNAKGEAAAAQSELAGARQEIVALQAKQTDRGLVMTLSDVLFDTGRSTLKPGADRELDRLAQALKDNSNTRVMIEGHTDSVGSDSFNEVLSERRAQAVADALRTRGVSSERYEAKGLGKSFPVASNDTAAGRQQNRRVEIVFSDDSGRFAQSGSQSSRSR
jgi:outer membrane protein OmpA-like peptidoglycan-associated protein